MPLPDGEGYFEVEVEYALGEDDPPSGNADNPVLSLPPFYSIHVNLYSYSFYSIPLYSYSFYSISLYSYSFYSIILYSYSFNSIHL